MTRFDAVIPGTAAPQGSKRHVGGGRMIEASKHLPGWRRHVTAHLIAHMIRAERIAGHDLFPLTGPTKLVVVFSFPRPKHHYRTGRFAHLLRAAAPRHMQVGPDLDKLVRAIGDALTTAGTILDDKQINLIIAGKRWTDDNPQVTIRLETTP